MRRHQDQSPYAMILHTARVVRGDRRAVTVAEQDAAAESDCVEQLRQHVRRLALHVVERAWQRDRRRLAIARARVDEHAGAGFLGELLREIAPGCDRTESLVQHHDGRRRIRPRADHAVFERCGADREVAGVGEGHEPSLRSFWGAPQARARNP